jgi:hypothetical protein
MQKLYIEMSEGSMVQGKNNYSVNTISVHLEKKSYT